MVNQVARENIDRAGLSSKVEVKVGPAINSLKALNPDEPFDLVFIDADWESVRVYFNEANDQTPQNLYSQQYSTAETTTGFNPGAFYFPPTSTLQARDAAALSSNVASGGLLQSQPGPMQAYEQPEGQYARSDWSDSGLSSTNYGHHHASDHAPMLSAGDHGAVYPNGRAYGQSLAAFAPLATGHQTTTTHNHPSQPSFDYPGQPDCYQVRSHELHLLSRADCDAWNQRSLDQAIAQSLGQTNANGYGNPNGGDFGALAGPSRIPFQLVEQTHNTENKKRLAAPPSSKKSVHIAADSKTLLPPSNLMLPQPLLGHELTNHGGFVSLLAQRWHCQHGAMIHVLTVARHF